MIWGSRSNPGTARGAPTLRVGKFLNDEEKTKPLTKATNMKKGLLCNDRLVRDDSCFDRREEKEQ